MSANKGKGRRSRAKPISHIGADRQELLALALRYHHLGESHAHLGFQYPWKSERVGQLIRRTLAAITPPLCGRYLRPRLPDALAASMDPDTRALALAHNADVVLLVDGTEFPVDDPNAFDVHHFMFSNKGKHVCGQTVALSLEIHGEDSVGGAIHARHADWLRRDA
jgi:hypothetical protein